MPKCICQICCCGKHRCPHYMPKYQPVSKEPCKIGDTEYQGKYVKKPEQGPKVIHRPHDNLKNDGRPDFDTTHNTHFVPHEYKRQPDNRPKETYRKREDPMDLNTEYNTKYLKGQTKGDRAALPDYFNKKTQPYGNGNDMIDKSVTQEDYTKKTQNERPEVHKLKDNVQNSNAPFDAKSLHQTDYQKFDQDRNRDFTRRPDNIDNKGLPMYYDTTHNDHFQKHSQRPRSSKGIRDSYQPNNAPFNGKSLMQTDYKHHEGVERNGAIVYDNSLFNSSDPIQSNTTNNQTYKQWDVKRELKKQDQVDYQKPSQKMDTQKTSDDYKNFGTKNASKTSRPKTNVNFTGEFDGLSSYQDVYKKHEVSPRSKHQRIRDYYQSNAPFDFQSENQDKYKKFNSSAPAHMIQRDNDVFQSDEPMGIETSYGDHYKGEKLPDCPSTKIVANNFKGYDLIDDFVHGHRFLVKNSENSAPSTFRGKESPLPPIGGGGSTQVYVEVK